MSRVTDPSYLCEEQYKTPANVTARANLHARFSTAPSAWHPWVMDQLALRPGERVLEVGGGPGWLWRENRPRLPADLRLCFSDFSAGMVQAARTALDGVTGISFGCFDAQYLPLPAGAFDVAIANFMLQHVPDLPRAVHELRRVLAAGGRLCAATFGTGHMRELRELLQEFDAGWADPDQVDAIRGPRLENAAEWLWPAFGKFEVVLRSDALWVTEAQPLVDYAYSTSNAIEGLGFERVGELEAYFQARIDADGGIFIAKSVGVVLAWAD